MVERAHFNPGDVSVAAQIETIRGAKPQALVAWTTGTALATILKGIVQAGLDIPVATTDGNMSVAQLHAVCGFHAQGALHPRRRSSRRMTGSSRSIRGSRRRSTRPMPR